MEPEGRHTYNRCLDDQFVEEIYYIKVYQWKDLQGTDEATVGTEFEFETRRNFPWDMVVFYN